MKKKMLFLTSVLLIGILTFSACSDTANNPTSTISSATSSTASSTIDINAKYAEPITITTVMQAGAEAKDKLPAGTTEENNAYTTYLKEKYNIILKVLWSAPTDQYYTKLNVSILSGDLPDFCIVNRAQYDILTKAKSVYDITETSKKYLSEEVQFWLNSDGGKALSSTTVGNKSYGIPLFNDILAYPLIPFIRTDWLKKLKLEEPKTMDDLIAVATAFATQDPDGNGKKDTYGFGLAKDIIYPTDWIFGLTGIFNSYHAYPGIWVKDASGKTVYGSVQPEMKVALEKVSTMYKNGLIDPEFGVKDFNKISEEMTAGKVGILYGQWYMPGWPLQLLKDKDPNATWKCFGNFATDTAKVLTQTEKVAINGFIVINKNTKNPEAVMKMINLGSDMVWGTDKIKTYGNKIKPEGGFYWEWVPAVLQSTVGILSTKELQKAVPARDPSLLKYANIESYNQCVAYLDGDNSKWGTYFRSTPNSPVTLISGLADKGEIIYNEFFGAPTTTMAQKKATLDAKLVEEVTKIIMGDAPVSNFDNVIKTWESSGGNDMTAEVNTYLESLK